MNPNLKIFFKRSFYFVVFALLIAALFYSIPRFFELDWSTVGSYFMYGLMGLMMTVMGVLITGVVARSVWTGIMNRTDTILMCCSDKIQNGVHMVCSHYNPGGESTEGFSAYFHYYIDENGKLYLSKKVGEDGNDITKSLVHLADQTRLQLEPDREKAKRIGAYNSGDNTVTDMTMPLRKGELHFLGYEGLIDYGFKIRYLVNGQLKWKVRI